VLVLSPNSLDDGLSQFFEGEGVEVIFVGKAINDVLHGIHPLTEEMITDSLRVIERGAAYPVMVMCRSGRTLTGVLVACLRKLQRWSLISIFEEFRRFAGGSRLQSQHEQFIELYDTELISISDESPDFLRR
jgi:tyrosine-protein phosphatase SIW14